LSISTAACQKFVTLLIGRVFNTITPLSFTLNVVPSISALFELKRLTLGFSFLFH